MKQGIIATLTLGLALGSLSARAEDQACATVRLADPGWSDIAATNAITGVLLQALGYTSKVDTLAVPIIYGGMRNGQVDAFLGNWMPAQQGYYDQFVKTGQVTELAQNLSGTEFTLAVPTYVWDSGVKTFADLAGHGDQFGKKIYGIGAGAPANQSLQKIIAGNEFGLGDWQLVESSEQAMLSQVGRAVKRDKWVVFLGWTPHPMNVDYPIKYLSGGEQYFGTAGTVNTLTRKGYAEQCPNPARLLANLRFTLDMENAVMSAARDQGGSYEAAAKAWLKAHPQAVEPWLQGVTTRAGQPALPAIQKAL
ncbi:choline ABC transporter substrate-binding protein [Pseudomonas oryzihabitans]|uniref:Glycine betaine/proline transport system substrate-binding protein n=1 Tax=Pseudomonas oryzihabitans TaxID=47885 RepID=A0AAJ2BK83_9PSED|nr:choline ABC transporter substrate-binding protein [Pseudomonas psychrotolerans]MDR6234380.1 glycine betaine/proline transport system substrate-binding protein [Pseudomonas psychrotolerans]MDR6356497.1 glycine betaine/proline transport system substrate-binding protein [Pseudomonas psychrotolerans]MDR6676795.1 glycine betaine/proline transport system substrate-binding protein [Pseudomonas psychrotolerans]